MSKRSVLSTPTSSMAVLLPLSSAVLAHAQALWQQGDWAALTQIELAQLAAQPPHPDRAQLCALVASAWAQAGDQATAQHFLHQALDWGCDKRLVTQLLVAGMHNTLGRAAAIAGDQVRLEQHFRRAVAGSGNQIERASLGRRHVELQRLGLESTEFGVLSAIPHSMNDQEASITYPPHGITSYAQNFEDVMLWRALWDVENGFYIDVGAWDPVIDSVSKAFYEHGWHGVHIEPLPEYADRIKKDRPKDKIYQVLLSADPGEEFFYYIPETGLSTVSKEFADLHEKSGWSVEKRRYPVMTLSQIFDDIGKQEIHWLKVDVEGLEKYVLKGWGNHPARPWVVVIEATKPCTSTTTHMEWEYIMTGMGYRYVYFDGLNRFYVSKEHEELCNKFKSPPNVFDGHKVSGYTFISLK